MRPRPKSYQDKPLPEKTDVVVIGGGFTGTSAALRLAKGGAKVTLLEAETIGWGASSRNGGQALSCLHQTLTELIEQHGLERAREMFRASVRAADTVARIVDEEKDRLRLRPKWEYRSGQQARSLRQIESGTGNSGACCGL